MSAVCPHVPEQEASSRVVTAASLLSLVLLLLSTGCATAPRSANIVTEPAQPQPAGNSAIGVASYYGKQYHGRKTASGEIYNMHKMTAAHRTLPFGVKVRVTELESDRSVIVRVNDRGPFARGRIIDLSLAAAQKLGMIRAGSAKVRLELVSDAQAASDLQLSTK